MTFALLKKWFDQAPPSYWPGHTLTCALADLREVFAPIAVETSHAVLAARADGLPIEVSERVERHFQMHLVSLEMSLTVAAQVEPGIRVDIRNTGLLRRTGVACAVSSKYRGKFAQLTGQITSDPELNEALMVLDFRRCSLESTTQGWMVRIEPYGASEVVNRMPSFRRYIRLGKEQAGVLKQALNAFSRILEQVT